MQRDGLWKEDGAKLAERACPRTGRNWPLAAGASSDRQTENTAEGSTGKPRCDPPSFFIPARKHFLSRQYRHWFLLSLSTTHCLLNLGRNRCEEQQDRACYRSEVTGQGRAPGSTIHLEQIS